MTNPYKPGDILCASWGYSMILVDFYRVVKATAKTVTLAHIGTKDNQATGFLSGTVLPDPDSIQNRQIWAAGQMTTVPEIFVRRVGSDGWVNGHHSSARAHKWDGTPQHYNHCD